MFWYNERVSKSRKTRVPVFTMCCMRGKIKLPVLQEPPALLHGLLTKNDPISKHYQDNIRALNMMFSFTSLGGKIDNSVNMGKGPKIFKLHGENYHLIGSVKPRADEPAKFSQLYIHDTENEVRNRLSALRYVIIKIIESENSLCKMNLRHADLTDVFSTLLLAGLPKTARSEKIWLRLL